MLSDDLVKSIFLRKVSKDVHTPTPRFLSYLRLIYRVVVLMDRSVPYTARLLSSTYKLTVSI